MSGNLKRRTAQWAAILCCLLVVGLLGNSALANVGFMANDGTDYIGRLIVVIGKPESGTMTCAGITLDVVNTVIINPGSGPAVLRQVGISGNQVPGKTNYVVANHLVCPDDASLLYMVLIAGSGGVHRGVTVFETTDVLDSDSTGVVTGSQDECGVAEVIFVKKGGPPVRSELATYDVLEPGDRIVDIVNLGPSGGGTLYAASVEY